MAQCTKCCKKDLLETEFTDEEVKNLLKDINVGNKRKQNYKELFKLENSIRDILKKRKMSKMSFNIILDILVPLRTIIVMHTLSTEDKLLMEMKTNGFKSNTDSNYYRWLDGTEEVTEPQIKKEVIKIITNLKKPLNDAEKEFRRIQKETKMYGCKLICPYCENEYVKEFGTKESGVEYEFIEKCPYCSKDYKVLSGNVTLWRGRGTGVVSYGSPEHTVRIKNKNGERVMIFNSNYNLLHIKKGDWLYFTFKKKFLSSQFSENPFSVLNATNDTYSLI